MLGPSPTEDLTVVPISLARNNLCLPLMTSLVQPLEVAVSATAVTEGIHYATYMVPTPNALKVYALNGPCRRRRV